MKTLLLVDGTGYLYRAFHALPDLRTASGAPTGAIRGFISMLRTLEAAVPSDYRACIFDAPGPTFRDELFPDYKGHRPPMPADLAAQVEPVRDAASALGWHVLVVPGIEADDVIGTLVHQARGRGVASVVATGDKDLAQLVADNVTLIDTMSRDGGPPRRLDRAGVEARFGVPPERIIDYLALVGDSVDNVPGVDKVGPKTAAKWIAQYGSLDGVIAHAAAIPGAVGENLRRSLDWLATARQLVTVRTDGDIAPHLPSFEALAVRGAEGARLRALYEQWEFRSWLRELGEPGGAAPVPADATAAVGSATAPAATPAAARPDVNYETVVTPEQLSRWVALIEGAELTCIDTETTSLDPMAARLVGISLSVEALAACYIPLAHRGPDVPRQLPFDEVLERLRPWLESARHAKVGQHLKYDAHVFANHGVHLSGIAHDTLLQSYVLEAHRPHDMDSLALRHLGRRTITYEEVCGKGAGQIGFDEVALDRATEYAAEDAEVTLALHRALWPRLQEVPALRDVYRDIEMPAAEVLFRMERNGVLVDRERLAAQSAELSAALVRLEAEAHRLAGQPFNLGSPKQIGEILFGKLGLPVVKKTASGAHSTDEEVLEKLARDYPLPRVLLDYRTASKLKSTYCDKLPAMINPATGRVHTHYGQAVAVTGRLSSSDPNLQNIPIRTPEGRRIREAFVAPPGCRIVSADYSQIELRIMAHLSDDAGLLAAFAAGADVHRATASEVFGVPVDEVAADQRRTAKVINFGLIYGMSAFGLASNLGIERDAAKLYIDRYFARYPGVANYMDRTRAAAHRDGYVETVFGRRLWLPEINAANGPRRQAAERAAINAPMQGTAADLIKKAMIAVQRWLDESRMATRLVLQVHDELVLEVPERELQEVKARVPELMRTVAELKVPLLAEVGVGDNWDQAH
ncbi:MAG TPA: DNA polymerase I [Burkholderiaceae bacterium]|nr:DNA polymerase I [Burkholderiaceae bacterium]